MTTIPVNPMSWDEDRLDRKQYADFLTAYLDGKCGPEQPALVLAIDAPWGLGKTFFVQRWAEDLKTQQRPVIAFDAWENDSAEAPTISFMAELRQGLTPLYDKVPLKSSAKIVVQAKAKELVINLRKATMPALTVIGKGLLKKATGVAVDELIEAANGKEDDVNGLGEIADNAPQALEAGLNKFFEKTLQGHVERMRSVKAFRASLEEMLLILHTHDIAKGPLYVFVDELDRCRPDYAIRLLEGIKHLFSVRGVVFVISTNLHQLSKAVGAVYGANFDGYSYLKRFFDFEYQLPEPSRYAFISMHIKDTNFDSLKVVSGLDSELDDSETTTAHAFAAVAEAFPLDLRAIQRVMTMAEAAISALDQNSPVLAVWLFFLAALRHKHPDEFEAVTRQNYDVAAFAAMCKRILLGDNNIKAKVRNKEGVTSEIVNVSLINTLNLLYEVTKLKKHELKDIVSRDPSYWCTPYPDNLRYVLSSDWRGNFNDYHPIRKYGALIVAAGYLSK